MRGNSMSYMMHLWLVMLFSLFFIGCESDDPAGPPEGQGRVVMYLADAPTDSFTEVNVEIESIEIYSEQKGWIELQTEAGIYNLLELTNGTMAMLVDVNVEADTYTMIRVHIGGESTIVVEGSMVDISIDAGAHEGIELVHHIELESGATTEILLDFDAHRSVSGSLVGGFVLDPVIRVQSMEEAGDVSGQVVPPEAKAVVIASQQGDIVTSTYADENSGEYKLVGLAEGEYDVEFVARSDGYETEVYSGVAVEAGQETELETVELENNDNYDN